MSPAELPPTPGEVEILPTGEPESVAASGCWKLVPVKPRTFAKGSWAANRAGQHKADKKSKRAKPSPRNLHPMELQWREFEHPAVATEAVVEENDTIETAIPDAAIPQAVPEPPVPVAAIIPILPTLPPQLRPTPRVARPLPEPEPVQSRAGGWVLVALATCALLVYFFQRVQHTDAELEVVQKDLQNVTAERDRLKAAGELTLESQQIELAQTKQKLGEISAKLEASTKELKELSEKSGDREKELQDLILFLKGEIQANESQIELMKKAINAKLEVRRPLP